jgi:hypothetical protein
MLDRVTPVVTGPPQQQAAAGKDERKYKIWQMTKYFDETQPDGITNGVVVGGQIHVLHF